MKNISHNSSGALETFESCVAVQSTTHESFDSMAGLSFSPAAQDSEVMKKHTQSRRVIGAAATPKKNAATSFISGGAK